MTPITAELLADEQAVRLVVTTRAAAAPGSEHRTEFALEVCPSPTCHCQDITLVRTATTAPDPEPPAEYMLDPFARTVVAASASGPSTGEPSAQAIAAAIPTEDWQRLRHVFFAAKARAYAAIDCSRERAEFPFDEVERWGELVPIRDVLPFAPFFTLPAAGDRQFMIDEQYCVQPGCDCTESIIGLSTYRSDDAGTEVQAEPLVDFQVDWQRNRWWVAGESRKLTPAEEDLRHQLLAANPALLAELGHRNGIMRRLYEVSAAAAGRPEGGQTPFRAARHIGRNEPCPCGSGRKYKRCCLLRENAASG